MTNNSVYAIASDLCTANDVLNVTDSSIAWKSVSGTVSIVDSASSRIDAIEEKLKQPDVDLTTKTELITKYGSIYVRHYKDGFFQSERKLMSDIVDVRVYDKTVVVIFADKTKTSAVLDEVDTFTVEQGISVCITKKLLGDDGNSLYNKLVTRALKVIKRKQKAEEAAVKKKEEEKKAREIKKARAERRKAKKREESINIQAEAIKRALSGLIGSKVN